MAKEKESITIALVNIVDKEVSVKEPNEKFKKNFKVDLLQLTINFNFAPSEVLDNLLLNVTIEYEYQSEDEKVELLKSAFTFHFKISDMDNIITFEGNKIDIPDGLATNLVSITLSTIRGLIAAKTRGYFINKFYFPIINPKELTSLFINENGKETELKKKK